MSQGVGIVLEGMYTALTRRRVGGYGGVLWSSFFIAVCGGMLYKSWYTRFSRRFKRSRCADSRLLSPG